MTDRTDQGSVVRGSLDREKGREFAEAEQRRATLENGQELAELAGLKSGLRNAVK